jgi:hypothetical protein
MAATQLNLLITVCNIGAKINCPKDPPAFIKPPANYLRSGGSCFAVAPISIE